MEFHFIRPQWLWALLAVVLLGPWLYRLLRQRTDWQQLIASHLSASLLRGPQQGNSRWPFWALWLSLLIIALAASGPSFWRSEVPLFNQQQGAVLVLDASLQTRAQDVSPDRFTRLHFKAMDVVQQFNLGQLGFVAYAGDAFTVTPLTRDSATILQSMRVLTPEIMPSPGNYPLLAMQEARRLLAAANYPQGDIIWLTGGIQRQDMEEIRRVLRNSNLRVHIIAAGTEAGAPIRDADGELLRDQRGRVVVAQLFTEYLQRIANESNGSLQLIQTDDSDVANILASLRVRAEAGVRNELSNAQQWYDFGPWLLLLLLPWLLIAARRGVVFSIALLVFMQPMPLWAASTPVQPFWQRPMQSQQQFAQQLFAAEQYAAAAEYFSDPMAQGAAWYRAGNYERAAAAFAQVSGPEAAYNRGNALAQLGALPEALAAYQTALAERPHWQAAQENYALVKSLLAQQEQEQSEGEGDDNADTSEQEDGESQANEQQGEHDDEAESEPQASEEQENEAGEQEQSAEANEQELDEQALNALELDDLAAEQAEELEQLLRRVEDDPALLLRNRLLLEAQRRRNQAPPRGN